MDRNSRTTKDDRNECAQGCLTSEIICILNRPMLAERRGNYKIQSAQKTRLTADNPQISAYHWDRNLDLGLLASKELRNPLTRLSKGLFGSALDPGATAPNASGKYFCHFPAYDICLGTGKTAVLLIFTFTGNFEMGCKSSVYHLESHINEPHQRTPRKGHCAYCAARPKTLTFTGLRVWAIHFDL